MYACPWHGKLPYPFLPRYLIALTYWVLVCLTRASEDVTKARWRIINFLPIISIASLHAIIVVGSAKRSLGLWTMSIAEAPQNSLNQRTFYPCPLAAKYTLILLPFLCCLASFILLRKQIDWNLIHSKLVHLEPTYRLGVVKSDLDCNVVWIPRMRFLPGPQLIPVAGIIIWIWGEREKKIWN